METRKEVIRRLNDELRTSRSPKGKIVMTSGIQSLGAVAIAKLVQAIAAFDQFNGDNDPHSEHDFGAIDFEGNRIFWKIDYYDRSLEYGSEDPANPNITARVMTIMLAEEY
jgi:Protein of unknown function (DUF3768)